MTGVFALIVATVINVFGLAALRWRGLSTESVLICLSIAYSVCGITYVVLARRDHAPRASAYQALAWAISISAIYVEFLVVEKKASLAQLIVLQALAPLFSGFFSKEVRRFSKSELFFQLGAVAVLLFLARLETLTGNPSGNSSVADWAGLSVLLVSYVVSQSVLRSVVRSGQSRLQMLAEGCLWVSAFLGGWAVFRYSSFGERVDGVFGGFFGVLLVVVQLLYVEGIRRARGVLGNLAISGAVPVSILVNSTMTERLSWGAVGLSLGYCALVVGAASLEQRRSTRS